MTNSRERELFVHLFREVRRMYNVILSENKSTEECFVCELLFTREMKIYDFLLFREAFQLNNALVALIFFVSN